MIELIFLVSLCSIVLGFYSMISKYYISKQYILKEIGNNSKKMTKIRGDYIDIIYNEIQIHIEKKEDGKWYSQKNMETSQKMTETELKINEPFNIEDKLFTITEKEIKGGFSVLLPLITTAISVLSLFLQGYFIANSSTEKNTSEEKRSTQIVRDSNVIADKEKNNHTENEDALTLPPIIIADNKDIHTIVTEYDDYFQNNIMIDWTSYNSNKLNSGHIRYKLENEPSETGLNATNNQGIIDWEKVKADDVDFALIHIGARRYGMNRNNGADDIIIDSNFKENMDGAVSNDIKVGTTFYSQAITKEEMDQEITAMLEAVKGYNLDYPMGISLSREERHRASILSDEEYIDLIKYFCISITEKGYTPMILGKENWFHQFPEKTFDGYLKLVATESGPPSDIDNCIIWGYGENSFDEVDGVSTTVSLYLSGYINMSKNNKN